MQGSLLLGKTRSMRMSEKILKLFDFIGKWSIITLGITASLFSFLSVFEISVFTPAAILFIMAATGVFLLVSKLPKPLRISLRAVLFVTWLLLLFFLRKALKVGICYASDAVIHVYNVYFEDTLIGFYDESNVVLPFKRDCMIVVLMVAAIYSFILVIATWYKVFASIHLVLSLLFVVPGLVLGRMPNSLLVSMLMIYYMFCFMYQRSKRIYPLRYLVLTMVSLLVIGLIFIVSPPSEYDGEARYKTAKERLNEITLHLKLDEFSMNNLKSLFEGNEPGETSEANGGVSDGKLGEIGKVNYADKVMLEVLLTPASNIVYLKGYVGTNYTGHSFEDISEDNAALFRKVSREYYEKNKVTSEVLEGTMFSPDLNQMGIQATWGYMMINYKGAETTYRYVPYFSNIYEENTDYYYGFRPKSKNLSKYEYRYVSMPEEEMYQAEEVFGKEAVQQVRLDETLEDFIYETECEVPEELCELFDELGFERDCYDGTGESLIMCINQIKHYFAQNTEYSLSPGKLKEGRDYVEDFLRYKKKGYCTAYASAGVMLLRYMGVPARYVAGYVIKPDAYPKEGRIAVNDYWSSVQDGNTQGDFLTNSYRSAVRVKVKDNCAHAWAEVYVKGLGFVPVEFTPGYGSDGDIELYTEEGGETTEPTTEPASESGTPSRESTGQKETVTGMPRLTTVDEENTPGFGVPSEGGGGTGRMAVVIFAILAAILGGSVLSYRLYKQHRKKFDYRTEDLVRNVAILTMLFEKMLHKRGITWTKNRNVTEIDREIMKLVEAAGEQASGLRGLKKGREAMMVMLKVKYGGLEATVTKEEYLIVKRYVEDVKKSLQYLKNKV